MKNIVIISDASDVHASAVAWGVRKAGHNAVVVNLSDPHELLKFRITAPNSSRAQVMYDGYNVDVCWLRRMRPINFTVLRLNEDLIKHVLVEYNAFRQNILHCLGVFPASRFINRYDLLTVAESKMVQLLYAYECGFKLPETIVTNDVEAIKNAFLGHSNLVVKPFSPHYWRQVGTNRKRVSIANSITLSELNQMEDGVVELCPGIYQARIHKTSDIRVVVIGKDMFACETKSDDKFVDTRFLDDPAKSCFDLPDDLKANLFRLASSLGMDFCSADVVIDNSGEFYFIELNPSGAMLMLENDCGHPILRALVEHVVGADVTDSITFDEYKTSACYTKFLEEHENTFKNDYVKGGHSNVSLARLY